MLLTKYLWNVSPESKFFHGASFTRHTKLYNYGILNVMGELSGPWAYLGPKKKLEQARKACLLGRTKFGKQEKHAIAKIREEGLIA